MMVPGALKDDRLQWASRLHSARSPVCEQLRTAGEQLQGIEHVVTPAPTTVRFSVATAPTSPVPG
jgi:hypothetical protein